MNKFSYYDKLDYTIDNLGYVSVARNNNYIFTSKTGKERNCLIYIEQGEIVYDFIALHKSLQLDKDTILFVPAKCPYIAKYQKDNTQIKFLAFDILAQHTPAQFSNPFCQKNARLSEIFKSITNENRNHSLFLAAKIYELLYLTCRENLIIPDRYKKLLPAISEIDLFFQENRKISYYSDMCGISESNFRKLFKEYTGKSFIEYRNYLRIAEARKLIATGEYTVSEAAYLTGFNNMSFFYEALKKY